MNIQEVMREHVSTLEKLFTDIKISDDANFLNDFIPELKEVEGVNIVMNFFGSIVGYLTAQGVPPAKLGAACVALSLMFREAAPHLVPKLPQSE